MKIITDYNVCFTNRTFMQ